MGGYVCVTLLEPQVCSIAVFRKENNLGDSRGNTVSDLSKNLADKSFCSRQILIELGRNKQVCQIFFRKKIEMPHRKVKKFNVFAVEFLYQNELVIH